MKIGLKSGYVFECDDNSYIETNKYSGELIHIFVTLKDRKKYTVNDEDIEFFESDLLDDDIEELATYGDDDDDDDIDMAFGWIQTRYLQSDDLLQHHKSQGDLICRI